MAPPFATDTLSRDDRGLSRYSCRRSRSPCGPHSPVNSHDTVNLHRPRCAVKPRRGESLAGYCPSQGPRGSIASDQEEDMNPADSLQLLERYAVVILPALVVAEQIGIPLPAVPALLGGRCPRCPWARQHSLVLCSDCHRGAGRGLRLVRAGPPPRCERADATVSPVARAGLVRAPGRERLRPLRRPGHAHREVRPRPDHGHAAARGRLRGRPRALRPLRSRGRSCSGRARGWGSGTSSATPSRWSRSAPPGWGARSVSSS